MSTRSVGKPLVRLDGRAKVTGEAKYSAEIAVARIAYAAIITSDIARGRIVEVDASKAEKEPGVLAVLWHANVMRLPGDTKQADPGDRVVQVLQDDRILYSNQPVALAVADTFERAVHAALLVRVSTASERHAVQMKDELENAFPQDIRRSSGNLPSDQVHGAPALALSEADAKIEATYELPPEIHNPLEPHATIAIWNGPEQVTIYDSTQGVFGVRRKIATAFALPIENVRVITKFVGGAFGCKGAPWSHVLLATLAAKQLNRPVKLALTRPQMFGMVGGRPNVRQHVAIGTSKDGQITALRHQSFSTTSRFDTFIEPAAMVSRHSYACENIESTHRLVRLDIGTPTFMRAPGESSGLFALESAMDEMAHRLEMDPLQLRLRNYARVDPIEGKPFSSKSLGACYETAAKRFGWERRSAKPRSQTRHGLLVGMGMAGSIYPANLGVAQAVARLLPDGTALVQSGTVDIGTGTYTVMAQVAADALGLPVSKVKFDLGDTEMPQAPRSSGSVTAASVGSAVLITCNSLRERLIRIAVADAKSQLNGKRPEEVQVENGVLSAGDRTDTYTEILRRAGAHAIEEHGEAKPGPDRKQYSMNSYGAQFAEVLVDPDLGTVRVSRLVGAFSAGRILNARTARSQLISGMVWGIGMALHEQAVYDRRLGRIITRDLADYHLPTNADVPDIDPILIEEEDSHVNPAGVKGLGEIGITGTAAAIANAVFNATGVRVRALPITPEKVLIKPAMNRQLRPSPQQPSASR
jgi:xanthine dehydrogenase YagR molybdenum-binding subunit